jgi:hypothetical protein
LLASVDLDDVTLESLDVRLDRSAYLKSDKLTLSIDRKVSFDDTDPTSPELFFEFDIVGIAGRKHIVTVRPTYRLALRSSKPLPESFIAVYASVSADIQVWPFARELASSMTSKMGISRLILPLVKQSKPAESAEPDAPGSKPRARGTRAPKKRQ